MNRRLLGTSRCAVVLAFSLSACGGGGGGGVTDPIADSRRPHADADTDAHADTDTDTDTDSNAQRRHRRASITTRRNIRHRTYIASRPMRSLPITPARPARASKSASSTAASIRISREFTGRIDPASGDVAGNRGVSDDGGHGTAVSAVAAAARNNRNTMGVAFDATIVSERADDPAPAPQRTAAPSSTTAIAAGIDAARLAGAKVINLSLGGSQPGSARLLGAMQRAVNAGIVIVVIAAGNDGTHQSRSVRPHPGASSFPAA